MAITLRDISTKDLPALAQLYVQVYTHFKVGEDWDVATAEKMLTWTYHRNPDLAILAEDNHQIIGAFLVAVKPWWDGNHLVDGEIFIAPNYQKQGLGTQLLKTVLKRAKEKYQAINWETYTFKNFPHPLNWYKQLGFTENQDWLMINGNIDQVLAKIKK